MSDLNMKYEYVERKHPKLFVGIHQLCWHHNNSSADKLVEYIFDIEQQLKQAHRAGWEQCLMEVIEELKYQHNLLVGEASLDYLATLEQCWNTIASMEYKEE